MIILKNYLSLLLTATLSASAFGQGTLTIVHSGENGSFPLVNNGKAATVIIDTADAKVVGIVAEAFCADIALITGVKPMVKTGKKASASYAIIAGTIGKSVIIDNLIKQKKISVTDVQGKWETFAISVVNDPAKGIKQAVVIVGSDRRGTAYGLFELSRMAGVSPWVWWADATPAHADNLFVTAGKTLVGPPAVKYRGIFLNDEDWGLKPWASQNMDTDVKDIGPKTYAHIFELLLRLKANFVWPAMHDCTKAFYYYPQNPVEADRYAIVVGGSHCEPMLRNNVFEWTENFQNEYGVKPGEWRYDTNQAQIYKYWDDRIQQSHNYESVYTIGMRGVHDGSMPGPKDRGEKLKLLEKVITDQRSIFEKYYPKASEVPQIFCPYKEVLSLYQAGLKLPDDVTIVWADDNHGYMRQLSTPEEQKRSGGSGVYYHISYWGAPHDYTWLCSTAPSLISYELTRAYENGASRLWVINVGDIKPAEMEIEFSMDMAWNVNQWSPEKAYDYAQQWAARTFGQEFAEPIARIKAEYYRLSQNAKPEHMGLVTFTDEEANERINDYQRLEDSTDALAPRIPDRLKDAWYEMIEFPVEGASLMSQKILLARKSIALQKAGDTTAFLYADKAKASFVKIKELTRHYNQDIANGKWNGMMSWNPRRLVVFNMPPVAERDPSVKSPDAGNPKAGASQKSTVPVAGASSSSIISITAHALSVPAALFQKKNEPVGQTIKVLQGLGLGGQSISVFPVTTAPVDTNNIASAPWVEYEVQQSAGTKTVSVKCLPTQSCFTNKELRYAISVNNEVPKIVNVNNPREDEIWKANVLRGFSEGKTEHTILGGKNTIRIYLLDAGLVVSKVEVY